MRGDENRVIEAYVTWLQRSNWTVRREVNFVDVYAERGKSGFTPRPSSNGAGSRAGHPVPSR